MALKLGEVNVDDMLEHITSNQYSEWVAYNRLLSEEFEKDKKKTEQDTKAKQAAKSGGW